MEGVELWLAVVVYVCVVLPVYFLPTAVAYRRDHKNFTALLALNVFGGWTVVGWVGALVWSLLRGEAGGD